MFIFCHIFHVLLINSNIESYRVGHYKESNVKYTDKKTWCQFEKKKKKKYTDINKNYPDVSANFTAASVQCSPETQFQCEIDICWPR